MRARASLRYVIVEGASVPALTTNGQGLGGDMNAPLNLNIQTTVVTVSFPTLKGAW